MAYPNLPADNEPGAAFTVELTEKNQPMEQGHQVGFDGVDEKDTGAPHGEQRKLLTSDVDVSHGRHRLNTEERVSFVIHVSK